MGKEYKNYTRSKNAIEKALIELLQEGHELDSISVTELSEKALVNRGTFYNHYQTVDDVLAGIEDEFMESLSLALVRTDLSSRAGRKKFFSELSSFLSMYSENAMAIWKYIPIRSFLDLKKRVSASLSTDFPKMVGEVKVDEDFLGKVRFFVTGLVGNYAEAILDPAIDSIEKVSERAYEMSDLIFFPAQANDSGEGE